jgi:hypothetical protein
LDRRQGPGKSAYTLPMVGNSALVTPSRYSLVLLVLATSIALCPNGVNGRLVTPAVAADSCAVLGLL